eukprot:3448977-Prymnesium_polylepis.1
MPPDSGATAWKSDAVAADAAVSRSPHPPPAEVHVLRGHPQSTRRAQSACNSQQSDNQHARKKCLPRAPNGLRTSRALWRRTMSSSCLRGENEIGFRCALAGAGAAAAAAASAARAWQENVGGCRCTRCAHGPPKYIHGLESE